MFSSGKKSMVSSCKKGMFSSGKKGMVFAEYSSEFEASNPMTGLQGFKIYEKPISITYVKK